MAAASEHVIDDLTASTEKELEMLLPLTNECYINRVPQTLRKFNEHYYTPKVVSIGPIHHGKEELRAMEEYKKRYLKDFLQLGEVSLKEYFELVRINETKLRSYYADAIEVDSKDFMKMVLLDAVFLLMILIYDEIVFEDMTIGRNRVFGKPSMIYDIKYDLLLLENQLPFFIIEELYKLSNIHNKCNISGLNLNGLYPEKKKFFLNEKTAMITLAIKFLNMLAIIEIPNQRHSPTKVEHLLALLRSCLKPVNWNPKRKPLSSAGTMIPSIKELSQAGVKFEVRGNQNLFDIEFNNGVLEIPYVAVHNFTELVFRNLIAFELCNELDLLCIDYFRMMHKFTSSSADAEVLISNKIIDTEDAQAVSTLFHNLSPGLIIYENKFGYSDVIHGLNAFYAVPWNRWKATWIQRYFKAPWAFFSFSAAVILLILTFVQTVCSILQVK